MSFNENMASVGIINDLGATGSMAILIADDDLIVTSTNMKLGTYTVAAQPKSPARISVLATAVGATDTMGTIAIVGTNSTGTAISETVIPIAGTLVYTTNHFATVTSVTGAAWVIAEGNDTIKVGVNYSQPPAGYYFFKLVTLAQAVITSQVNVSGAINAKLSAYTALPVNSVVYGKFSAIVPASGELIGYLARV